jgi:SAM-dependent methyltransferase
MERDWDSRAREAPEYYIATAHRQWQRDEFFQSGKINVENDILADIDVICHGRELRRMRVLEIGCGAGRMTKAMAGVFGEVHAVDISAEMIALAKHNLSDLPNVVLYKNNGIDLSGIPDRSCDFAFSFVVFQHIPALGVIENYVREVHRCLKPGAVFKFQVQGDTGTLSNRRQDDADTWVGVPMSLSDARALAARCGFELIRSSGHGTQYFWLWFLKPKWHWLPASIRRINLEGLRFRCSKRVTVTFLPLSVRPGETYRVRIPRFAGQAIDVGYELTAERSPAPVSGIAGKWCELDPQGEASILVPAEHPAGVVRITRVRSQTGGGRWYRAGGAIQVTRAND